MESKDCLQCGSSFEKPYFESEKNWINRHKFCSRNCVNLFQKGKALKNIDYESRIPWNKGKSWDERFGDNHPLWKGDNVGYVSLHRWVYRHKGKPICCKKCHDIRSKYQWANISRTYKRDLNDWVSLCSSCHKKADINKHDLSHLTDQ